MKLKESIILRTWKGDRNGSILITIPNKIIKEYNLEQPAHLILERLPEGIFLRKLDLESQNQTIDSIQQLLSTEIDLEVINFESLWYQGSTAFKDAQQSAGRIFKLLKLKYGTSCSTKQIVKK